MDFQTFIGAAVNFPLETSWVCKVKVVVGWECVWTAFPHLFCVWERIPTLFSCFGL